MKQTMEDSSFAVLLLSTSATDELIVFDKFGTDEYVGAVPFFVSQLGQQTETAALPCTSWTHFLIGIINETFCIVTFLVDQNIAERQCYVSHRQRRLCTAYWVNSIAPSHCSTTSRCQRLCTIIQTK